MPLVTIDTRPPSEVLSQHRGLIRSVLRKFGVVSAGVFGSIARGEDVPGSDIDLIVEFAPGQRPDVIGITIELEAMLGVPVDVVDEKAVWRRVRATGIGTTILRDTVPL